MLGGEGSGLAFHEHDEAFNLLGVGTKRWFVFPPGHVAKHNVVVPHTRDRDRWLSTDLPNMPAEQRPLQCTQLAGDVVYVPTGFLHGVWNAAASATAAVSAVAFARTDI